MPVAVRLYGSAAAFMAKLGKANAGRLVLSLFFKAVLGIQRIFHFETLDDPGFAVLTGGRKVLDRNTLGGWIRAVPLAGVGRFIKQTAARLPKAPCHFISIDEHAIARFTRKFEIQKGFHTIRNKHMKVEKLFFPFDIARRALLPLIVTTGDQGLGTIAAQLLVSLRRRARGACLRVVLDAGAAHDHDELLELAGYRHQVTLVRVPRRPSYRKQWQQLPPKAWARKEEPGRYTGAAPKVVRVAETRMQVKGQSGRQREARTIIVVEQNKRGKDRWHALWIFGDDQTPAWDLVQQFRARQHHEQTYRVLLHDAYVDTAPSGYDKNSPDPDRPRFKPNAITLYAWIAALATNALLDLSRTLPVKFLRAHPRTLRRWFLCIPADIFLTPNTLIVLLRPRRLRSVWHSLIALANRRHVRIPWLNNRRLVLSLQPSTRISPEVAFDPAPNAAGVWC